MPRIQVRAAVVPSDLVADTNHELLPLLLRTYWQMHQRVMKAEANAVRVHFAPLIVCTIHPSLCALCTPHRVHYAPLIV